MKHKQTSNRLWDSSDEGSSSEEDFEFLENIAKGAKMTELESKLIQGVMSAPLKDKKRFDKKRLLA
jgi:hypothetical protein